MSFSRGFIWLFGQLLVSFSALFFQFDKSYDIDLTARSGICAGQKVLLKNSVVFLIYMHRQMWRLVQVSGLSSQEHPWRKMDHQEVYCAFLIRSIWSWSVELVSQLLEVLYAVPGIHV